MTDDSGTERVFDGRPSGAQQAPWIDPSRRYTFRLYTTTPARRQLKTVSIGEPVAVGTAVAAASEPADSNPVINALPFVLVTALVLIAVAVTSPGRG